jgi:hypothetical protein
MRVFGNCSQYFCCSAAWFPLEYLSAWSSVLGQMATSHLSPSMSAPTADTCPKPETPAFVLVFLVVPACTDLVAPSLLSERSLPRNHLLTILRSAAASNPA